MFAIAIPETPRRRVGGCASVLFVMALAWSSAALARDPCVQNSHYLDIARRAQANYEQQLMNLQDNLSRLNQEEKDHRNRMSGLRCGFRSAPRLECRDQARKVNELKSLRRQLERRARRLTKKIRGASYTEAKLSRRGDRLNCAGPRRAGPPAHIDPALGAAIGVGIMTGIIGGMGNRGAPTFGGGGGGHHHGCPDCTGF